MNNQNTENLSPEQTRLTNDKQVWEDDDFLRKIDCRVKEIEAGKVTGSTWEDVKSKSKS
jgi:hypothetical protein